MTVYTSSGGERAFSLWPRIMHQRKMFQRTLCVTTALFAAACASPTSPPAAAATDPAPNKLKTYYSWKQLDWQYTSVEERSQAITAGVFNASKANPLAFDLWKDKMFLSIPRWKATGVPASVSYINITENPEGSSPLLKPYPNAEVNTVPEKAYVEGEPLPNKIVGGIRVRVDENCDRLYVFDAGLVNIFDPKVYGPSKILVYDLKTDALIRQYPLKATDKGPQSFFANIVVDSQPGKCDESFVYLPDIDEKAIVIYDYKQNDSWRIKHNYFHFEPTFTLFNISGDSFHWEDGVFGLALSKLNPDGYRTLYFHPLASSQEFKVSTQILQNKTLCDDPESFFSFKYLGSKGPDSQASSSFLDPATGILYFTQLSKSGVGCWNSITNANKFGPETIALIAQDDKELIFPNEVKVDKGDLWVLSNRVPLFAHQKIDPNDVNYRIFKTNAKDLYKGTVCDPDYKG